MSGADVATCIENIDIGGPAMIRSAAKNHKHVSVIVEPSDYEQIHTALDQGGFSLEERQALAAKAYSHTATYDVHVASWMGNVVAGKDNPEGFPHWLGATYNLVDILRYGENPHQKAALYQSGFGAPGIASAELLQGKAMSFNNYVDADSALRAAYDFEMPTIAIIKHANPCGIASADTLSDAYLKALNSDPVSAFGGVIAANRIIDGNTAREIVKLFTEVVIATDFDAEAREVFSSKPNLRIVKVLSGYQTGVEMKAVSGGLLLQTQDALQAIGDDPMTWQKVAGADLTGEVFGDLVFAWRAIRGVKSNAILVAQNQATVGIGMGQVNRVDASQLAVSRAGARAAGAVAASDAFFPFPDGLQILIDAGVRAVVAPSGSMRDEEVIAAANAGGITLYHTDARHFFH
jgi:phosphoribosylaminoimidazolecarboxamide formyltransferase/IMP cyclohydrolase